MDNWGERKMMEEEEEEEEEEYGGRRFPRWILAVILIGAILLVGTYAYLQYKSRPSKAPEQFVQAPVIYPTYNFSIAFREGNNLTLEINRVKQGTHQDTLEAVLTPSESLSWKGGEKVTVLSDQKLIEVKPNYDVAFFGENYELRVRRVETGEILWSEEVTLEAVRYSPDEFPIILNETFMGDAVERVGVYIGDARLYPESFEGDNPRERYQFLVIDLVAQNEGNIGTEFRFENADAFLKTSSNYYYRAIQPPEFDCYIEPRDANTTQAIFEIPLNERPNELFVYYGNVVRTSEGNEEDLGDKSMVLVVPKAITVGGPRAGPCTLMTPITEMCQTFTGFQDLLGSCQPIQNILGGCPLL